MASGGSWSRMLQEDVDHGQANRIQGNRPRDAAAPAGDAAHPRLERDLPRASPTRSCATRGRAAWTAASRSATTAARWATSSPSGTTWSTRTAGATPSTCSSRPTTSPSSPAGSAPRRARRPACSASTSKPVTIKLIEQNIIEHAFKRGLGQAPAARPRAPARRWPWSAPGRPGWPARRSSTRPGTAVTVFERADRIGGLLTYGIPNFKLEKWVVDRRDQADGGRGHHVRHQRQRRLQRQGRGPAPRLRRHRALRRRDQGARPERPRPRARRASTSRWSTCRSRTSSTSAIASPDAVHHAPRTST